MNRLRLLLILAVSAFCASCGEPNPAGQSGQPMGLLPSPAARHLGLWEVKNPDDSFNMAAFLFGSENKCVMRTKDDGSHPMSYSIDYDNSPIHLTMTDPKDPQSQLNWDVTLLSDDELNMTMSQGGPRGVMGWVIELKRSQNEQLLKEMNVVLAR